MMMSDVVPKRRGMKIFKVCPGGTFRGRLASDAVIWVRQHWLRRAEICLGEGRCPACEYQGARAVGFMAAIEAGGRVGLLEVSPMAIERFLGLVGSEHGGRLEGCVGLGFTAERRGHRCPLMLAPEGEPVGVVPVALSRIREAVCTIYRLPMIRDDEQVEDYLDRGHPAMAQRLRAEVDSWLKSDRRK